MDLTKEIKTKKTFLCVGLDPDLTKIPQHLLQTKDPIFEFNKAIIDATKDICVAYKPNFAFYEAQGPKGWESLQKTVDYIGDNHFKIADAKRADIGNTAQQYAKSVFEHMNFDAITLSPYMGQDSVQPFLTYPDKYVILLTLTSNAGSTDFQTKKLLTGDYLFEEVLQESSKWQNADRIMYVVGATKAEYLKIVRRWAPNNFLLIPGIGAQGGNAHEVIQHGINQNIGLLINVARSIIYAGEDINFQEKVRAKALEYAHMMAKHLINFQ